MKRAIFTALALTILVGEAHAQCALDLKTTDLRGGKQYEVSWARVPDATGYVLEESAIAPGFVNRFEFSQNQTVSRFKRQFERQTTYDVVVTYRVTALGMAACSGTTSVVFKTDSGFRKAMTRSVIPLVGSAPGANGALFKTSLRLRANASGGQKGKIVFHPVGVPATANDPSIPFNLPTAESKIEWDDIVVAFGATGLGTIDIVPDVLQGNVLSRVPTADVRLFNVTEAGTFGTLGTQVQPFSFHEENPVADAALTVTVPGPELRINMGVRTFLASDIDVVVVRGDQTIVNRTISQSADILQFTSAAAFTGADLQPGDAITVRVRGAGVPMYTLTDNRTNDPALFVPPAMIEYEVDRYQIID